MCIMLRLLYMRMLCMSVLYRLSRLVYRKNRVIDRSCWCWCPWLKFATRTRIQQCYNMYLQAQGTHTFSGENKKRSFDTDRLVGAMVCDFFIAAVGL